MLERLNAIKALVLQFIKDERSGGDWPEWAVIILICVLLAVSFL